MKKTSLSSTLLLAGLAMAGAQSFQKVKANPTPINWTGESPERWIAPSTTYWRGRKFKTKALLKRRQRNKMARKSRQRNRQ